MSNAVREFWERFQGWSRQRQFRIVAVVILVVALAVAAIRFGQDTGSSSSAASRASTLTTAPRTNPPSTLLPPTTGAPSPSALPGGLAPLTIAEPRPAGYDRDLFGSGWIDADHDCQDSRAEILIAQSRVPVTFTSVRDCTVAAGQWVDPWSGSVSTSARALDIDHTVPLANAWRSGAFAWTTEERIAYANDLTDAGHLLAIPLGENRSKGDGGPEAWKPPSHAVWCAYAQLWDRIKAHWELTASTTEWSTLLTMAATC